MQTKPNLTGLRAFYETTRATTRLPFSSSLLIYGVGWLEFDIEWSQIVVSLGTLLC